MSGDSFVEVYYDSTAFIGDSLRSPDGCAEITNTGRKYDKFWCQPYSRHQEGKHVSLGGALNVEYRERGDVRYPRDDGNVRIKILEDPNDINSDGDRISCDSFGRDDVDSPWVCEREDAPDLEIETDEISYVG